MFIDDGPMLNQSFNNSLNQQLNQGHKYASKLME